MIAAGVARKLVFSWLGNPGVGGLGAIRRRIEGDDPGRAARGRGVQPLRDGRALHGRRDEPAVLPAALLLRDRPADGQPAHPADRARPTATGRSTPCRRSARTSRSSTPSAPTAGGDTQVWGLLGCQKEAAFAADRVIVVVEELVDEAVIRADPNRTIIPGLIVDAVVVEPWGAHPSYVQGAYDRDNRFYLDWDPITRDEADDRRPGCASGSTASTAGGYLEKLGRRADRVAPARARRRPARSTTGSTADDARRRRSRKSEMMIVAAARELAGQRVCFVGVGLPNIAVNLAKRTVAPDLELVYEAGVFGARPARLPLTIGDPTIVTGATAVVSMLELFGYYLQGGLIDVGFLGAAQIDRFGNINTTVIGDVRPPDDPPARLGRRVRDRDQRPPGLRDHAPEQAQLRRDDRLPDVARQPRRRRAGRADPARGRLARPRADGRRDRPRHLPLRRDRRDAARLAPPGRDASRPSATRSAGTWRSRPDLAATPPPTAEELRLIREELDPGGVYTK